MITNAEISKGHIMDYPDVRKSAEGDYSALL